MNGLDSRVSPYHVMPSTLDIGALDIANY